MPWLMLLPCIAEVDGKPHRQMLFSSDLRKPCLITGESLSICLKICSVLEKS